MGITSARESENVRFSLAKAFPLENRTCIIEAEITDKCVSENKATPTNGTAPDNEVGAFNRSEEKLSPLRVQRLERKLACEGDRLQALEQNLKALHEQLNYTGNLADRNNLKRQIDAIEQSEHL